LVLFAPKEWEGPYQIEPAGRWRISLIEEAKQIRMVLRPRQPAAGQLHVTVRGKLPRDHQDALDIPAIRLVEPAPRENLLAIARSISGQAVRWQQVQGLQPVRARRSMEQQIGDANGWFVYRREDAAEPASARVVIVEQSSSTPQISWMESTAVLSDEQRTQVTTDFTLDPRGRRSCELLLPKGCRLLAIRVNGRRQAVWKLASQRWQVHFDSTQLPQLIQVNCLRNTAVSGAARKLDAPILLIDGDPVPVSQTAWQIVAAQPWRRSDAAQGEVAEVGGQFVAAMRLTNLVEMFGEARPALLASRPENRSDWLAYWREQIAASEAEYRAQVGTADEPTDGAEADRAVADKDAAAAVDLALERLAALDESLASEARVAHPANSDIGGRGNSLGTHGGLADTFEVNFLGAGRVDSFHLRRPAGREGFARERILGGLFLSIVAVAAAIPRRRAHSEEPGSTLPARTFFTLAIFTIWSGHLWAIAGGLTVAVLVIVLRMRRHDPA
jgi:hypothetical protein